MFQLEYNGKTTATTEIQPEAMGIAFRAEAPLWPPVSPWADEIDAKGNPTGVITSGYWRIVPVVQ